MTILSVVQDVCRTVGVIAPTSIFSGISTNRTMQEILTCTNEMAQRIAYDLREWTKLKVTVTYVGDGVTTAWPLSANYKRMLKTANVWRSTSTQRPMRFISDTDEWLQRRAAQQTDAWGEWTLLGDFMHIFPAMGVGVSAFYAYLDKNCVVLNGGGYGDVFVNDNDRYRLNERLLKLGVIWQWKAQKGSPYAEDMGTYSDCLSTESGTDKPNPILIDRAPASNYSRLAYPWPVTGPPWPFP